MPTRMHPSITTKYPVVSTGRKFVISAGVTLKSISAKPIAIANEKMICPRVISVSTSPSFASGSWAA